MLRPRAMVAVLLLAAGIVALPGCAGRDDVRHVILISIDSLRADHVGCYGYGPPTTPRIDAFAAGGVRFERSYAATPWTLPSHVSQLTGLHADVHAVDRFRSSLGDDALTLAEALGAAGWGTAAVVCAPLLSRRYGLHQGFEVYDEELIAGTPEEARLVKVADGVTDRALALLDGAGAAPLFLFLHYWDPHYDYNPAPEYVEIFDPDYAGRLDGLNIHDRTDLRPGMDPRDLRHLVALYDGEIRYTDRAIGRLLDGLRERGLLDAALIVLTADHGEEFLEHGGTKHTHTCYEEAIRVPLIVRCPWRERRAPVRRELASGVDIFPTVLDLLDLPPLPHLQGRSLAFAWSGDEPPPADDAAPPVVAATRYGKLAPNARTQGPWHALLDPAGPKLHEIALPNATHRLLFDLATDPAEQRDLAPGSPDLLQTARTRLDTLRAHHRHLYEQLQLEAASDLDEKLKETLEGLGYL